MANEIISERFEVKDSIKNEYRILENNLRDLTLELNYLYESKIQLLNEHI